MPDHNILNTIGNTPLVKLKRLSPSSGVEIWAKLEGKNPGGSIKDRIALNMIERAEERGELSKEKIILEASSGNTGIGLAMVAAVKGYRCLIAMSEAASVERRRIMRAYGAEILLTPASMGTDGAIEAVYKLDRENPGKYFCTDQYNNPDNWKTHYNTTAPEIWEQTNGRVTHIVATLGTTGTLMGITRKFREIAPEVEIVGMEPYLGHAIQGLKNMKESYRPGIFDKKLPDRIMCCGDEEAFEASRRLAREEGILAGMSSGAALAVALKVASELDSGLIVIIIPDGGERYLSTSLFEIEDLRCTKGSCSVLRLSNTLKGKKEVFEPLVPGEASIYSCGPTVDEYTGFGMCRRLIAVDLLRRVLEFHGYKTTHVVNITDMDDRTINASAEAGKSLGEFTDHYTESFFEDVKCLDVMPATHYPRASSHIGLMTEMAEKLVELGYAYVKHGSVYFDISKLPSYGRLSGADLTGIDVGRTVDLDDYEKDSPVDFTIFKRVTLDELKRGIGIETPWGMARPGWHIECVAMATKYLGPFFDIHTSGVNLVFPHHENEIAMATALTGRPLARHWVHSDLVLVDGRSMHSRAGNVITLRELLKKGYSGREIRYFLLRTHYKKAINFSYAKLDEAIKALGRIDKFIADLVVLAQEREEDGVSSASFSELLDETRNDFINAINNDLNISKAMGVIFSFIRTVNALIDQGDFSSNDASDALVMLEDLDFIVKIFNISKEREDIGKELKDMIDQRQAARKKRDWQAADALRKRLLEEGIEVIDTASGTRWRKIK